MHNISDSKVNLHNRRYSQNATMKLKLNSAKMVRLKQISRMASQVIANARIINIINLVARS